MAGGDVVFTLKNQTGLPVIFDKIERPSAYVVGYEESIAKKIPPNGSTKVHLTRPFGSLTVEATLFYGFLVGDTRVDFHAYGYCSTSLTGGSGERARYDFRAAGISADQTLTLDGKTYGATMDARKVRIAGSEHPVTGNVVQFYEYHIDLVLTAH